MRSESDATIMTTTSVQRTEGDSEGNPGADSGELRVEVDVGAIGATG